MLTVFNEELLDIKIDLQQCITKGRVFKLGNITYVEIQGYYNQKSECLSFVWFSKPISNYNITDTNINIKDICKLFLKYSNITPHSNINFQTYEEQDGYIYLSVYTKSTGKYRTFKPKQYILE